MELDWTTFALQIVNFLVLVWLLQRFLYRPVSAVIARRREGIERSMADAREAEARAQALQRDYETRLGEMERTRAEAHARLDAQIAEARRERLAALDEELAAERTRRAALAAGEAEAAARRAETVARGQAAAFLARLLERLAGPELDRRVVDMVLEDLAALGEDARESLRAAAAEADAQLTVASARALDEADQARLAEALAACLGRTLPLAVALDASLIGGLRIALGPWVLAASLADELAFFREGIRRGCA